MIDGRFCDIRPGLKEEGEEGYWVLSLPAQVWTTDEVRLLAACVPNDYIAAELLAVIEGRDPLDP